MRRLGYTRYVARAATRAPGSPTRWAAKHPTLAYFNEASKGGHFAAWEEPELFSEEVRAAFRTLL
jgi:hypothetical protein